MYFWEFTSTRTFSIEDQRGFASFSGDRNPMHLDHVAARRTQAGAPVVHGMNAVIWAIGTLSEILEAPISSLNVQFKKFIYLDTPVTLTIRHMSTDRLDAELSAEGLSVASIKFGAKDRVKLEAPALHSAGPISAAEVRDLSFDRIHAHNSGSVPLPDGAQCLILFPKACELLGVGAIQSLAALSTLVGMECPGLHSIFS